MREGNEVATIEKMKGNEIACEEEKEMWTGRKNQDSKGGIQNEMGKRRM